MNKGPQIAKVLGQEIGELIQLDIKTCEVVVITAVWYWYMDRSIVKQKLEMFQKGHFRNISGKRMKTFGYLNGKNIYFLLQQKIISRWIKDPNVKSRTLSVIILY